MDDPVARLYVELLSVSRINTAEQSFDASFYIRIGLPRSDYNEERIGRVEVECLNIIDTKRLTINVGHDESMWQLHCLLSGSFFHKQQLRTFPFDVQDIELRLEVWDRVGYDSGLVKGSFRCRSDEAPHMIKEDGFGVADFACASVETHANDDNEYHYHGFAFRTRVRRLPFYYITNLVFPLFLLVSLTGTAFAVPYEDAADRLSVSLTLLLTVVAYKFVVASTLPAVAYLTWLDKYSLAALCVLSLVVAENALASVLGEAFDTAAQITCVSVWVAINLGFAISALQLHRRQDMLSKDASLDDAGSHVHSESASPEKQVLLLNEQNLRKRINSTTL